LADADYFITIVTMVKKIGVLGSGTVGQTLANGFTSLGFNVQIGSRDGKKVENWKGSTGTFEEVAKDADLVVLAVKGLAAEGVVSSISQSLSKKIVIDTTNPISDIPPENGVLDYFTSLSDSLMERLQRVASDAYFVKAFNSVGSAKMVNPVFKDGRPTMFICGNSKSAKKEVISILDKLGWDSEDMGVASSARAIEPLCMLWCIPGLTRNQWSHAFKLLK